MNINRAFWIFALLTVLTMASDRILFVIFPNYLLNLKFSATQIGLIFSIASLMLLISRTFVGKASDRFGRKRIMSAGLLVESISVAFFPIATKLHEFSIVKGLREVSDTLSTSVKDALIADIFERKIRDKIIRKLGNIFAFSRALAVLIGFIVVTYFSLFLGFYVASILLFLGFIIFTIFIKEVKGKTKFKTKFKMSIKEYPLAFKLIVIVSFLWGILFTSAYYPGFFILARNLGVAEGLLFLFLFVSYIVGGVFIFLLGKQIDRLNKAKIVFIGSLTTSVLFVAYPFSTSMLQFFLILLGVHFFYVLFRIGFKTVLLNSTIKRFRGEQIGFQRTIEGIGEMIGPVLGGFLIDTISLSSAFFFAGAIGLLSVVTSYFLVKG